MKKMVGADISDNNPVCVICRYSVRKFQVFSEPCFLSFGKTLNLSPFIRISKYCKKDNHDDVPKKMFCIRGVTVIWHCVRVLLDFPYQGILISRKNYT